MEILEIRGRLHQLIDEMEDTKAEEIYALLTDDAGRWEYTDKFKAELDKRYEYYRNGGKMISAEEAKEQILTLLQPRK